MKLSVLLVTIPRYHDRALATQRHLTHEMGFSEQNIEWVKGHEAADPESNASVHAAINASHHRVAKYIVTQPRDNIPIIIEDDCRFVAKNNMTPETLTAAVKFLDVFDPAWQILMVGHCPLGPICPLTEYPGLCRTSFPFSSICYILNPKVLPELMVDIPASSWRRPFMVEGWLGLGFTHKYAFTESLTTMGDTPKEIRCVPVLNTMDLVAGVWSLSTLGKLLNPLLGGLFRVLHLLAQLWLVVFVRNRPMYTHTNTTTLKTGDLITVRHYPGCEALVARSSIPTHTGVIYRDPVTYCVYIYHISGLNYDGFSIFFRPQPDGLLLEPLEKYLQWAIEKQKTRVAVYRLEVTSPKHRQTLQRKFDHLVSDNAVTRTYVMQPAHNMCAQVHMSKPELFPFIGEPEYEVRDEEVHYSNCFNAVMDIYEQIGVCRGRPHREIVNVDAFVNPNLSFPLRKGFSFRCDVNCLQKKKP